MLVLKILLTPVLIGAATLIQRRFGPSAGGIVVGLPLTAGPVMLFVSLERGEAFAAQAASSTLLGVFSLAGFCAAYGWAARYAKWSDSTLAALATYAVIAVACAQFPVPLVGSILVAVTGITVGLWSLPRTHFQNVASSSPRWDLPARAVIATGIVLALTGAAEIVGPRWTGILAPFPVFAGVMTVFTHRAQGAAAAHSVLGGVLGASFTYVLFFALLSVTLESLGVTRAFGVTLVACVAFHAALVGPLQRRLAPRGA